MARFTRVLTSKEFVELKPYLKYAQQDIEIHDWEVLIRAFSVVVSEGCLYRTPFVRRLAKAYTADTGNVNLPKCLTV